jgi:transcriptional regulator GlxA family with amidase domain
MLVSGEGNATSVAFVAGYESATQFSREYARHFGLPPSRDAAQLRKAAVAGSLSRKASSRADR